MATGGDDSPLSLYIWRKLMREYIENRDSLIEDNKGSVLVFTAAIIMMMLMIATFQLVIGFIFRDQIVVLDALDSAITASLSPAEEVIRPTFYYEKFKITEYVTIDGTQFPTAYEWINYDDKDVAGYSGNYIRLDKGEAESNAREYFERYLELNKADYTIENFDFEVEYDNERLLPVVNARWHTSYPVSWWKAEFGDAGDFVFPNQLMYIRYPRWVKTTINTTVRMPIPFGMGLASMLEADGNSRFSAITKTYQSQGIKEIKVVNPPPIYGWE